MLDLADERVGRRHSAARGDGVAHLLELVERTLHDIESRGRGFDVAAGNPFDQRLERVAQRAHRGDAGHPRSALERVQQTLELDGRGRRGILTQRAQRELRVVEKLGRLLGENRGDLGVIDVACGRRGDLGVIDVACGRRDGLGRRRGNRPLGARGCLPRRFGRGCRRLSGGCGRRRSVRRSGARRSGRLRSRGTGERGERARHLGARRIITARDERIGHPLDFDGRRAQRLDALVR